MPVRPVRLVLLALVALLVAPAATVSAAPRLQIGFYDDPSFRWSGSIPQNLASARAAGGSIIHTTADWSQIAPTKPRVALDPDDKAYKLGDLDALVRDSARYGQQVMINISGSPRWANGGKASNHAPTSMASLTTFARMLASRYSGKNPGLGSVSKWSVWNEPNLEIFLSPQFSGKKIVSPGIYAKIYAAAYKGIKAGNPLAKVAAGETSNRGRDKPIKGVSASVAPATFARLLAQATPKIRFDAWATHPYPTYPSFGPTQKVAWPNVTMTRLEQFGTGLQSWYHRRVPIWITEYGQQTRSAPRGVSNAKQAADARVALRMAAANPYVEMFCWFIIRDSNDKTWRSGLLSAGGARKPAFGAFASTAKLLDGVTFRVAASRSPRIKLYVPFMSYRAPTGAVLGITYRVFDGKRLVAIGQPSSPLGADQSVSFTAVFKPAKKKTYRLVADVNDASGNHEARTVAIVTP
jgi:Cellulase (glycosyl hydrolase family 5)